MKAIVYKKYGTPNVLEMQEVAKPSPKDKEILVRVHATTVTVADVKVRSFDVPPSIWLPARLTLGFFKPKNQILGAELAGEVEAVGQNVTRFKSGDQIYAATLPHFGGYAEYHCLHEDTAVSHIPKNLSYEEAAASANWGTHSIVLSAQSKHQKRAKNPDLWRIRKCRHICGSACQIFWSRSHRSMQHKKS